jgi:hypothetical protein
VPQFITHLLAAAPLAQAGGLDAIKRIVDELCRPYWFLSIITLVFVLMFVFYKRWTRPVVFTVLFTLFFAAYFASAADRNFHAIVAKPDNIPITLMVIGVVFCLWIAFRRAAMNDTRTAGGLPLLEGSHDDKVLVWPDLVYTELLCMVIASALLILWAILAKAPLEEPANPGYAPNPAKAPWYFLGLQEMLVYYDPWMAGVVYPALIILGLCAIPYIDTNPKGNGYYTLRERPFAISVFLFGFIVLWVVLIFFGTFLRGPNWNFFGPFEAWDPHKHPALTNIDLSQFFWDDIARRGPPDAGSNPIALLPVWLVREWLGLFIIAGYFTITPAILRFTAMKKMYAQMGPMRFAIMVILLLFMALLPIKMVLRWLFNFRYFIYLPEANFSF